jgi:hypothetical protein
MSVSLPILDFSLFLERGTERRAEGPAYRPYRKLVGLVACCLTLGVAAAPAKADVIELSDGGSVLVRANDLSPGATDSAPEGEALDLIGDLGLPDAAVTLVGSSAAPVAFAAAVEHLSELNHLSPALLEALVWQESRWRAGARSSAGAIGLAQLMPGTARDLGVNPHDPTANLAGGARYLRQQLDRFDGDVELALAAYNAGPGRVLRGRTIPKIRETELYVRSIVDRLSGQSVEQGRRP